MGHYIMKDDGEPRTHESKPIFRGFRYVRVDNWPQGLGQFKYHSSPARVPEVIGTLSLDFQLLSSPGFYIYKNFALGCQ